MTRPVFRIDPAQLAEAMKDFDPSRLPKGFDKFLK